MFTSPYTGAHDAPVAHARFPSMTESAQSVRACPPRRQALHLPVGQRSGRGGRVDARPPRRQGCRARGDDQGRRCRSPRASPSPPRPATTTSTPASSCPRGLWEDVLDAVKARRGRVRQGLRRSGQPAPRERALGRQVLDAGHDGHRPQPGPQRADRGGPRRPHRQRAVRCGRLPALHPDVRPDRAGRERRALRPRARRRQARARREAGHGPRRGGAARDRGDVQGDRRRRTPAPRSPRTPTSSWTWP